MRGSESIAQAFASTLREARTGAGLTQEDLAHLSGLDRTTVSQVERGKASPQVETLIRLAGGLDISPCELLPNVRWEPPAVSVGPRGKFLFAPPPRG